MTTSILYLGASANAGKTVFTRAHCRILSNLGFAPAPFKPVCVTKRMETRGSISLDFRMWLLGAAARIVVTQDNCPIQIAVADAFSGELRMGSARLGTVALIAEDSPMLTTEQADIARAHIASAYTSLADSSDVLVVEGAGNCTDLPTALDLANVGVADLVEPVAVLVAGAASGGALAALAGTLARLAPQLRERVIGLALNDVRGGAAELDRGAREIADRAGVAYLGALPHCSIYNKIPPVSTRLFAMTNWSMSGWPTTSLTTSTSHFCIPK